MHQFRTSAVAASILSFERDQSSRWDETTTKGDERKLTSSGLGLSSGCAADDFVSILAGLIVVGYTR